MAMTFSAGNNQSTVDAIVLDQAPADPTYSQNSDGSFTLNAPTTDFDGTQISANPSKPGSSGCDDVWFCGAPVQSDGTSAIDNLGGADCAASFTLFHEASSPGQVHTIPATAIPALPGGGKFAVRAFASDGQ